MSVEKHYCSDQSTTRKDPVWFQEGIILGIWEPEVYTLDGRLMPQPNCRNLLYFASLEQIHDEPLLCDYYVNTTPEPLVIHDEYNPTTPKDDMSEPLVIHDEHNTTTPKDDIPEPLVIQDEHNPTTPKNDVEQSKPI